MSWDDSYMDTCGVCQSEECEYWTIHEKGHSESGSTCYDCGVHTHPVIKKEILPLDEINHLRECSELPPLKELTKLHQRFKVEELEIVST